MIEAESPRRRPVGGERDRAGRQRNGIARRKRTRHRGDVAPISHGRARPRTPRRCVGIDDACGSHVHVVVPDERVPLSVGRSTRPRRPSGLALCDDLRRVGEHAALRVERTPVRPAAHIELHRALAVHQLPGRQLVRVDRRVGDGGERRGEAEIVEQRTPGPRARVDEVERSPVLASTGHLVVESHAVTEPDRVHASAHQ